MLNEKNDLVFHGVDQRRSRYDVIYPQSDAKLPLLVFCHGFKGFKDWGHFPLVCRNLAAAGQSVVKFNFSHNGLSLDSKDEFDDLPAFAENNYLKELEDIDLLIQHLQTVDEFKEMIDFDNISLLGHSRGGSMAILYGLASKNIKRIISWAAVADLEERLPSQAELKDWQQKGQRSILNGRTGQQMPMNFQFVKALREHADKLSLERQLKKAGKPFLVIHGEKDQAVPLEHAYALQIWYPKAELLSLPNADHTFGGSHPYPAKELPEPSIEALKASVEFLKRHSGLGGSV